MNALDYMAMNSITKQQYSKFACFKLQIIFVALILLIGMRNFRLSIQMVIIRSRTLTSWCCLIPCILIIVRSVVYQFFIPGYYFNFRQAAWLIINDISIVNICNNIMLF
jgi:hypothetical protein